MKKVLALSFLVMFLTSFLTAQSEDAETPECNYTKNEVDEFTGTSKLSLGKEVFIKHTDDEMKKYIKKNKDYTKCEISLSRIDKTKVAYVTWTLQTEKAYEYYGSIDKGSKFLLKFTNGETIELNHLKYNNGKTQYGLGYTTYMSYMILDDTTIEILKTNKVEKARMYWSKGYKDYPVFNPDLFINQIPCIE